jgi:hypothetical protein
MEIERARAVCTTAQAIIDSARVEVKYMEVTGEGEQRAKKFFDPEEKRPLTFSEGRKNLLA